MRSIRRSRQPAGLSIPSFLKSAVSNWCPDRQSDQIRRSRTRGIVASLLAFLQIRPYRCEEFDYRFFRRPLRHKPKAIRLARTTDARDCNHLTPREAFQDGHTPHIDMD